MKEFKMSPQFLKCIIVIVFFLFLIVLLFFYFLAVRKLSIVENNVSVAKKQPATYVPALTKSVDDPTKTVAPLDKNQCAVLESEIRTMLDEANYCTQDSDCILLPPLACEFAGCYLLLPKNTNIEHIQKSINNYYEKSCGYISDCSCMPSPQPQEIKCIANKCVDIPDFSE